MEDILLQTQNLTGKAPQYLQRADDNLREGAAKGASFADRYKIKEEENAKESDPEEEFKKLMDKVDREIERMKQEARYEEMRRRQRAEVKKAREKKLKKKKLMQEQFERSLKRPALKKVFYLIQNTNNKLVNVKVCALTDPRYCDKKTGIIWFHNYEFGAYMIGEEAEKLEKWCRENGRDPLEKFEEMVKESKILDSQQDSEANKDSMI